MVKKATINIKKCKEAPKNVFLEKAEIFICRKEKNLIELVDVWKKVQKQKSGRYSSIDGGLLSQELVQLQPAFQELSKGYI